MKRMTGWVFSGLVVLTAAVPLATLYGQQTVKAAPTPPPALPPVQTRLPHQQPVTSSTEVRPSSIAQVTPGVPGTLPAAAPAATPQVQVTTPAPIVPQSIPGVLTALKFDSESKDYSSKPGEMVAPFTFWLTNTSGADVSVTSVRTSCGCTVAKLPATPWVIPPGQGGPIDVTVNLAGKSGLITKAVTVESTAGAKSLLVRVNIAGTQPGFGQPAMADADRLKNMQQALADRQVLFKNHDCAKCHADPAKGLTDGRQVYAAVCGVCHDSSIRASMVPDLRLIAHQTDKEFWKNWVTYGRAGSMMPAFAQSEGGPLTDQQITSLVDFLDQAYPSRRLPGIIQQNAAALRSSPAVRTPSVVSPPIAVPQ